MVYWDHGVLGSWCTGIMVCWDHGVLGSWCAGIMVYWDHGVLGSWCTGTSMKIIPVIKCSNKIEKALKNQEVGIFNLQAKRKGG